MLCYLLLHRARRAIAIGKITQVLKHIERTNILIPIIIEYTLFNNLLNFALRLRNQPLN